MKLSAHPIPIFCGGLGVTIYGLTTEDNAIGVVMGVVLMAFGLFLFLRHRIQRIRLIRQSRKRSPKRPT